jgi:hypothetical protein
VQPDEYLDAVFLADGASSGSESETGMRSMVVLARTVKRELKGAVGLLRDGVVTREVSEVKSSETLQCAVED